MKHDKQIEEFFINKRKRRKVLAKLPVEEKFNILLKIQKIASSILGSRGVKRQPWGEIEIEQDNSSGVENSLPVRISFFCATKKNDFGYLDLTYDVNFEAKNTGFGSKQWRGYK